MANKLSEGIENSTDKLGGIGFKEPDISEWVNDILSGDYFLRKEDKEENPYDPNY